jgi:Ca2+/H+ antiporter
MNGITIIEEHLCRVVELRSLIGIGIFMTLMCGAIIAFYRWASKNCDNSSKKAARVCSILIIILYVITLAVQIYNYNRTHMEYTVTVDDSVSFNDFHEKYEIVSVDRNEYRVKEK